MPDMDYTAHLYGRQQEEDTGKQLLDLLQEPFSQQVYPNARYHKFPSLLTPSVSFKLPHCIQL